MKSGMGAIGVHLRSSAANIVLNLPRQQVRTAACPFFNPAARPPIFAICRYPLSSPHNLK
jgi:hypothetical protein